MRDEIDVLSCAYVIWLFSISEIQIQCSEMRQSYPNVLTDSDWRAFPQYTTSMSDEMKTSFHCYWGVAETTTRLPTRYWLLLSSSIPDAYLHSAGAWRLAVIFCWPPVLVGESHVILTSFLRPPIANAGASGLLEVIHTSSDVNTWVQVGRHVLMSLHSSAWPCAAPWKDYYRRARYDQLHKRIIVVLVTPELVEKWKDIHRHHPNSGQARIWERRSGGITLTADTKQIIQMVKIVIPTFIPGSISKWVEKFASALIQLHKKCYLTITNWIDSLSLSLLGAGGSYLCGSVTTAFPPNLNILPDNTAA